MAVRRPIVITSTGKKELPSGDKLPSDALPHFLDVTQYGAAGDGVTDDTTAIQNAANAAVAAGLELYWPVGRYIVGDILGVKGSVRWHGEGSGTVIVGTGRTLDGKDIGNRVRIEAELEASERTATGQTLAAGDTDLTLDDATGLAVDDEVLLYLGEATTDTNEPFLRWFSRIAAIDGDDITLADPIPEDINGTDHIVWKVLTPARNVSLRNLTLVNFPIELEHVQGANLSDLFIEEVNGAFWVVASYNVTIERITALRVYSVGQVFSAYYGWFLQGWGQYGLRVRDIWIRNLEGVPFWSNEAESRDVVLENIRIGVSAGSGPANLNLFQTDPNTPYALVRNLWVDFLDDAAQRNLLHYASYENVFFGGVASTALTFFLGSHRGVLRLPSGKQFGTRVPFRYVLRPPTGAEDTQFTLPQQGTLCRLRIFASSLTGVTTFTHYGTNSVLSDLVAGEYVDLSKHYACGIHPSATNATSESRIFNVVTDGSQPDNLHFIIEGELLQSDESAQTVTEITLTTAAPTTDADSFGQTLFDCATRRLYKAISVGNGAADWLLIGQKHNDAATAPPDEDDDETAGYSVGSRWCDLTNSAIYSCIDATEGAAVWLRMDNERPPIQLVASSTPYGAGSVGDGVDQNPITLAGAITDGYAVILVAGYSGSNYRPGSGSTFNGVACTVLADLADFTQAVVLGVALGDLAAGTYHFVSDTAGDLYAYAQQILVFQNVNQAFPVGNSATGHNSTTALSVTVSSAEGQVVVGCAFSDSTGTLTADSGVVETGQVTHTSTHNAFGYKAGETSVAFGWTKSADSFSGIAAVALLPV